MLDERLLDERPVLELQIGRVDRDALLDLRARVLSQPGDKVRTLSRDLAPSSRHWAAHLNDAVVGVLSVMALRGWALRGMAVDDAHRRRGIGRHLLHVACAEVAAPMWCNARVAAVPFYVALAWVEVGPVFEINKHGPHQRLVWSVGRRAGRSDLCGFCC